MTPDQLRQVLTDDRNAESRRQTKRTLFYGFVVAPLCVVALFGGLALLGLVLDWLG
jgi:hypothetical protein